MTSGHDVAESEAALITAQEAALRTQRDEISGLRLELDELRPARDALQLAASRLQAAEAELATLRRQLADTTGALEAARRDVATIEASVAFRGARWLSRRRIANVAMRTTSRVIGRRRR